MLLFGLCQGIPVIPVSSVSANLFDPETGLPARQKVAVAVKVALGLAVVIGGARLCLIFMALQMTSMPVLDHANQ